MAKKKTKNVIAHILISSMEGLEAAFNNYVDDRLALLKKKIKQEQELAELKAAHSEANSELEASILSLETSIQLYATNNRAALLPNEAESKSRTLANGTIGFRLNPYAVSMLLPKDTWQAIADRLEAAEWGEPYVKTTTSVNKEELLSHRADLTEAQLKQVGITFTQGETFFMEPDSKLLEDARKPAEAAPTQEVAA